VDFSCVTVSFCLFVVHCIRITPTQAFCFRVAFFENFERGQEAGEATFTISTSALIQQHTCELATNLTTV
jgi:hypothetical protein